MSTSQVLPETQNEEPPSPTYVPGMEFPDISNRPIPPEPPKPPPVLPKNSDTKVHSANPNTIQARKLLELYFSTFAYPFTRHHIDSYDQFLIEDFPAILKSNNPILILKELIPRTNTYMYRVEIFVGGLNGDEIEIGSPTISLQKTKEVRILFPNEARLRNLTYSTSVYVNVFVRITIDIGDEPLVINRVYNRMPLFQIPLLLHSRFCLLHGKPASFLREAGECPQDQGGYFVIDGSEKVLITRQEQAFNTFYVQKQPNNDKVETYGNITCLSSETRQVKVVSFSWVRETDTLVVSLPYIRKPVPIIVLFRAMGLQADEDILKLIYPDLESAEAKLAVPLLLPSIAEAFPFMDSFSAIQFMKAMTKGFSEEHVYDILFNQTFIHISDKYGGSRIHFLADCVRRFMRVHVGIDPNADRDDTRSQRALSSGHLIRMLFANAYNFWKKKVRLSIDEEYVYHAETYTGEKFQNIFSEGNTDKIFNLKMITEGLSRGFKGRWVTGGAGGGGAMGHSDEKSGVLQAMSRISYLDFMSHTRRVVLNFDTGMKLTRPRQLHTSQYGYYCTNETPGGASIGITKNLSLMTLISTASDPKPVIRMLVERGWVIPCSEMRSDIQRSAVPFFLNNGIIGYTLQPFEITSVLKLMKWTGCLPATASISFSIRNRRVFLFLDEGRPVRPLIHLGDRGSIPKDILAAAKSWRSLVLGNLPLTLKHEITSSNFVDPLSEIPGPLSYSQYKDALKNNTGVIEYIDPYEQNEAFIINFPEHATESASHMEIHPCTIVSIVNGMVPFANFNQSPRNQLSCSQSKQAVGLYATNFQNRYDNTANILCYGEAPLVRTLTYDILGEGLMPYGHTLTMAIMPFQGYNQDDGIVFNEDAFQRGMFRNINYRSYNTFEEIDPLANTRSTIANPLRVNQWTDLKPGYDYTKLDDRGIIKVDEYVDENTVIVGKYIQDKAGKIKDSSLTPQVWTSGRVESVVVTVNNLGMLLVKIRITQDRTPELGDKFSTRHGQKGTIGMRFRAHDLPRTADGLVPDMIVNPHCIPSRMTVAQLMEMIFGEVCYKNTMIGDATLFMSDPTAVDAIGRVLEGQFGMEKTGNRIVYDGMSGVQMPTTIFMGPVFAMRLKHMVEDKWNARAEGRKEQRTHQPTGGRGAQGGLRIGEMERDALIAHGVSDFLKESLMERADKTDIRVCNGCGTVPIFNQRQNLFVCSLCDGPVQFIGTTAANMEILPTVKRSLATTSIAQMPYATKLLADELQTYMNMGIRILTGNAVSKFKEPSDMELPSKEQIQEALNKPLPASVMPETRVPEYREKPVEEQGASEEDLYAMGVVQKPGEVETIEEPITVIVPTQPQQTPLTQDQGQAGGMSQQMPSQMPSQMQPISYQIPSPPMQMPQGMVMPAHLHQQGGMPMPLAMPMQMQPIMYQNPSPPMQMPQGMMMPAHLYQQGGMPMPLQMQPIIYENPSPPMQMPEFPYQQTPTDIPNDMSQTGGRPTIHRAPVPNGPPTIVIDTSPRMMNQSGLAFQSRRNVTPRARAGSPRPQRATGGGRSSMVVDGLTANSKITVNKLG